MQIVCTILIKPHWIFGSANYSVTDPSWNLLNDLGIMLYLLPICEPWCWNMPEQNSTSFAGSYTPAPWFAYGLYTHDRFVSSCFRSPLEQKICDGKNHLIIIRYLVYPYVYMCIYIYTQYVSHVYQYLTLFHDIPMIPSLLLINSPCLMVQSQRMQSFLMVTPRFISCLIGKTMVKPWLTG